MESYLLWTFTLLLTGITAAFYFLYPRISRRGLLFGVYVGEQGSASDQARRITRSWYWGITLWLGMSILLGIVAGLYIQPMLAPVGAALFLTAGFLEEYLRAYRKARKLAPEFGPPAAAAMLAEPESLPLPYLAIGVGCIAGLYALGFAWYQYGALPDQVPTHFGFSGRPDAWRPRSIFTVMLLPFMALVLGAGLGVVSILIGQAKRAIRYQDRGVSFEAQQRFRRIMANFMAVTAMLVSAFMAAMSVSSIRVALGESRILSPAIMIMGLSLVLFGLGGSIFIALRYGQGGSALERGAGDAPLTDGLADNRLWVLGMFYVNRDDPSLFVERRFGLGYTLNFGNPKAVTLGAVFLGLILVISILAIATN